MFLALNFLTLNTFCVLIYLRPWPTTTKSVWYNSETFIYINLLLLKWKSGSVRTEEITRSVDKNKLEPQSHLTQNVELNKVPVLQINCSLSKIIRLDTYILVLRMIWVYLRA